jgi:hypothetical protein
MRGQKWRRYFYKPRFPIAIEAEECSAPLFGNEAGATEGKGGATNSRRGEPIAH